MEKITHVYLGLLREQALDEANKIRAACSGGGSAITLARLDAANAFSMLHEVIGQLVPRSCLREAGHVEPHEFGGPGSPSGGCHHVARLQWGWEIAEGFTERDDVAAPHGGDRMADQKPEKTAARPRGGGA